MDNPCCPTGLSCLFGALCICIPCAWYYTLREGEEVVLLECGRFLGKIKKPGFHYVNPLFQREKASIKQNIIHVPVSKVVDIRGNPIDVSGVVNFKIMDSKKALLDVENVHKFVLNQALAVLKTVCS